MNVVTHEAIVKLVNEILPLLSDLYLVRNAKNARGRALLNVRAQAVVNAIEEKGLEAAFHCSSYPFIKACYTRVTGKSVTCECDYCHRSFKQIRKVGWRKFCGEECRRLSRAEYLKRYNKRWLKENKDSNDRRQAIYQKEYRRRKRDELALTATMAGSKLLEGTMEGTITKMSRKGAKMLREFGAEASQAGV